MPVQRFRAENFRCLRNVAFNADPHYTLVTGANASGKTSLLEALVYLGRGKSFRGAPTSSLVTHGEQNFVLFGKVSTGQRVASIGVRNGRGGLEVHVDGSADAGIAELATLLPLAVIDPDVHDLVAAGPDQRRRYLDWIAFHVEHDFLGHWRRYRRVLKQRNAALKTGAAGLDAWDAELVEHGLKLDAARRATLALCESSLVEQGSELLGGEVRFEYRPGWPEDRSLAEALTDGVDRDIAQGATQAGPHRADLKLVHDDRQARRLVSRGQQKLLACSMVLAATAVVQTRLERPLLLMLDDPAAELDAASLERLMGRVYALGSQVIATALDPEVLRFPEEPARFHVEHGVLSRV